MKKLFTNNHLWQILFSFFFLSIFLQLLNLADKGVTYDSLWKIFTLAFLILSTLFYNIYNKLKINKQTLLIILIYTIYKLILPYLHGDFANIKFSFIVNILYPPISLFIFLVILDNAMLSKLSITKLSFYLLLVILYTCIFNLYTNFNNIFNILNITSPYQYNFNSVFTNRNTFGFFLFIGLILLLMYISNTSSKKILAYFLGAIVLLNLIISFSRASIFSTIIFIIAFLLIYNFKKNLLPLMIIFIIVICLIYIMKLDTFVIEFIIRPEQGLTGRSEIYNSSIYIILSNNIFIGLGEIKAVSVLYEMTNKYIFHNTFITLIVNEGLISFCFFTILVIYCIKNIYFILKNDRIMGSIFLSSLIAYIGYSLVESLLLFNSSTNSYIITLIIVLLPKYYKNYLSQKNNLVKI